MKNKANKAYEIREFWERVRKTAAIVDKWPDWKKGGINVEQSGIVINKSEESE